MAKQLQLSQLQESLMRRQESRDILFELQNFERALKKTSNSRLFEYVPIKIVACFEDFFREKYKGLIDRAEFRSKLKEIDYLKKQNFDFDILGAFQDNAITLGDYFSYLIPCSKLEDITGTLTKLLGFDFINKMKSKNDATETLLKSINEIFRLRHIFCHEVPQIEGITVEKALNLIDSARSFMLIVEKIIDEVLFPNAPQTSIDIENEANRRLKLAEEELDCLIETIKSKDQDDYLIVAKFDYMDSWKKYREERAKSESSYSKGGSLHTFVYISCLESITNAFIKELKSEYSYLLKNNNTLENKD